MGCQMSESPNCAMTEGSDNFASREWQLYVASRRARSPPLPNQAVSSGSVCASEETRLSAITRIPGSNSDDLRVLLSR
jgi:hypothetical protein